MKILFFIEGLHPGGKERRLVELIKGLSKNTNFEMELVITKKEIHYQDIQSANIKIHCIKRRFFKKDPIIFYKFYKITKNFKPDIIHVWSNLVAIYAIPSKVILKIPMINNQIGDVPTQENNSILGHKLSFPFSNTIIANSYAGLKAYKAPKNKSSVIYNGFDFNRILNLTDKNIIKNKFKITTKYVVGMVASFTVLKDYKTYIEAASNVLETKSDVTFLCIGSGDSNGYQEMVEIKNRKKILFLGKQNNVESIMNVCDIGVLATYTEGISNALLEFSALGKPTIATLGGGTNELIVDGETGFLIKQESPNELANKILFFLNNQKDRGKFGNNARERIEKVFNIDKMITSFIDLYKETLEFK